jgi:hypothetical protein
MTRINDSIARASVPAEQPAWQYLQYDCAEDVVQTVLLIVLGHPEGISAADVGMYAGRRIDSALGKLRELRARGEVENARLGCTNGGSINRWFSAEAAHEAKEEFAAIKRSLLAQQEARRRARKYADYRQRVESEIGGFEDDPVHRLVPAATAMPLAGLGPRWVFDFGYRA